MTVKQMNCYKLKKNKSKCGFIKGWFNLNYDFKTSSHSSLSLLCTGQRFVFTVEYCVSPLFASLYTVCIPQSRAFGS